VFLRGFGFVGDGLPLASQKQVDCWIGVVQETDRRLVRLAGRLSVAQVPELLGACAESLPVQLDLTDLVSADAAGIEALQRLRGKGATLYGAPGYIQLKLDSPARHEASAPRQAVAPKKADPHKKVER
jgi:hypothetical protein